jgi:hypothetical protein
MVLGVEGEAAVKKETDPLVEQWKDMVRPRAIPGHRRRKAPPRPLVVVTLLVMIVTIAAVTFAGERPVRRRRQPSSRCPLRPSG